jgi:hypothetical protein
MEEKISQRDKLDDYEERQDKIRTIEQQNTARRMGDLMGDLMRETSKNSTCMTTTPDQRAPKDYYQYTGQIIGCQIDSPLVMEQNTNTPEPIPSFEELGRLVGKLVEEKNKSYGSSFDKGGIFLKLLYPNGVKPEQYTDMLCIIRLFDKLIRVATSKDAFGESPYRDLAGYSLLGLRKDLLDKLDSSRAKSS